jgi:predicted lipoprotein with Yx(FWY)xxD motif
VQRATLIPILAVATAAVIAGCGASNSQNTSTQASSQSASTAPQSASTAPQTASTTPQTAATTHTTASSNMPVALVTTKHDKLGTVLAYGNKKLTVYLFEGDKRHGSSCTGACAAAWPPVVGKPKAAGAVTASDLSTITRADGTTQVTYKGHPLYLFTKDKDDGDTYGQGIKAFGAEWYVLAPSGKKIDNS